MRNAPSRRARALLGLVMGMAPISGCAAHAPNAVLDQTQRFERTIVLPSPRSIGPFSLEETLELRRSERVFRPDELPLDVIGQIFWAGQGVTDEAGHRTAPSAGARYPIELYAISATTFMHYLPHDHSVEQRSDVMTLQRLGDDVFGQEFVTSAPTVLAITGIVARTEQEYGAAAGDLMNREAGHVAQNMLLQATALGLAAVPIGGFDSAAVTRAMALAPGEEVLYLIPVGQHTNDS